MIVRVATGAVQRKMDRPFLPTFRAAVKPAINNVVLHELARSRRWKAESQRVGKFHPCWWAFGGNEVRPFQELERFLQPRVWSKFQQGLDPHAPHNLNSQPVNQFGHRCDHTDSAVSEDAWYLLPNRITDENGHCDVAIAPRSAMGGDPAGDRPREQKKRRDRHNDRQKPKTKNYVPRLQVGSRICSCNHTAEREEHAQRREAPPWDAQLADAGKRQPGDNHHGKLHGDATQLRSRAKPRASREDDSGDDNDRDKQSTRPRQSRREFGQATYQAERAQHAEHEPSETP